MNRQNIVIKLQESYIPNRYELIDKDFLAFEEEMTTQEDLELILTSSESKVKLPNPHNSIILYLVGLTNEFDFVKNRSNMVGGASPDIDVDWPALDRAKAIELVVEEWGRDNVANIITHGTLKPKSLTRRYFKLSTPVDSFEADKHLSLMREILGKFPPPLFGKEATLKEIIEGNPDKSYPAHPELLESKYADWYKFASSLEEMICNFGIHAAGIVISDFPIYERIPMWSNSKSERITQFDMNEVENACGMLKFDFLIINNLDILKECVRLIHQRTGKQYDIYDIPDGNEQAYKLLHSGSVQGIFQFEASRMTRDLLMKAKPTSISELSDLTSLCRPGPAQFIPTYLENKLSGEKPDGLPDIIANITKNTGYILIYQEQVMRLCTEIAGYTLREADDIRKALGKKIASKLIPYRTSFITGCIKNGLSEAYATDYWDNTLVPFASYSFNASHACSYSTITYICAYFKANYPLEFFSALMSTRSRVMQPELWAEKAPEYIQEAKTLGVHIRSPSVQASDIGFTIHSKEIYFGLNGIRTIGTTASKGIIRARGDVKFKDIWDFLGRIDTRIINTKVFEALIIAGAFDTMGYSRNELRSKYHELAEYLPSLQEWTLREEQRKLRDIENLRIDQLRTELEEKVSAAKKFARELKKVKQPIPENIELLLNHKEIFESISTNTIVPDDNLQEFYNRYGNLRKLPSLKEQPKPIEPTLIRSKQITVSVEELMAQAEYVGCYLGTHPAKIIFPSATAISLLEEDYIQEAAGQITALKAIKTKKGDDMAFMTINDGTASCEAVIFPKIYKRLLDKKLIPNSGDIVMIQGQVDAIDPIIKMKLDNIKIHRRPNDSI